MNKTQFPALDEALMKERLAAPTGKVRVLIDTDTANEIDDQYAIAWALLSPDSITVEAVTAEPYSFAHHRKELQSIEKALDQNEVADEYMVGGFQGWVKRLHAQGRRVADIDFVDAAQGMELSYREIVNVYGKLDMTTEGKVFRGAPAYMSAPDEPVRSEAVDVIIDCARSGSSPLYIAALGCVTNIASALLLAPDIRENIVVVWTSAYPSNAPNCNRPSLNLVQDVHASRLIFDCGVPHIYLPGYQVGAQLKISLPEMEQFVRGKGAIGDYLHHLYTHNPLHSMFAIEDTKRRTWVIWDIINIAWLINPEWVPTMLTTSPILTDELFWRKDKDRHLMSEAHDVQRDEIFLNFYDALATVS